MMNVESLLRKLVFSPQLHLIQIQIPNGKCYNAIGIKDSDFATSSETVNEQSQE